VKLNDNKEFSLVEVVLRFDCYLGEVILLDPCGVTETLSNGHEFTFLLKCRTRQAKSNIWQTI